MKKNVMTVQTIAEVAIFAAIAFVLDWVQSGISKSIPFLVNGGSIGIAMLPIIVICFRRGLLPGVLCGFIVSVVQMLGGIWVIPGNQFENQVMQVLGPIFQVLLDYILAYTVVGFAGLFAKQYKNASNSKKKMIYVILGTIIAGLLKYLCHVLSGWLFWPGEMWGISGALYSIVYNATYCIPNIVLVLIIMILFTRFYPNFLECELDKELIKKEVK